LCEVLAYDASDMVRLVDALGKKGGGKRGGRAQPAQERDAPEPALLGCDNY